LSVRWTRPALADFVEVQQYIANENPDAARRVAERVWQSVQHLVGNPHAGREGHVGGTREWLISDTPYLVVYRIRNGEVEILRLWHGRKNWRSI